MEPSTASDVPARGAVPVPVAAARRPRQGLAAIGIAAHRRCSRSACNEPATATLVFSYHEQVARLVGLTDEAQPQTYDLCGRHADRTSPPRGWQLADTRPPVTEAPRRVDDEDTVAIIAAALRGDDAPRRVDVIEGGDSLAPPRRVTATTAPDVDDAMGAANGAAEGGEGDPLRAALEELQRVVVPDAVDEGAPTPAIPLARRRLRDLPPPPAAPPPGPPPAAPAADDVRDRPTLW